MEQTSALTRKRVRAAWWFLAPMIITLIMVAGWPLLRTLWFSMTNATLDGSGVTEFIGFDNYVVYEDGEYYGILFDPTWWQSVWNTLYFAVVSVSLETVFGIIVALVLNTKFKGQGLVRAAVLVPWAIPTIVSAKMWGWMLHDQFGIVNDFLMTIGVIAAPLAWTADSDMSLNVVIAVDVWKTTPFMALLVLAALQMLPSDCYEAARIDGIHPVRVFFKVTLPLIMPAVMVAVVFRALDALRVFDLIYVLTPSNEATMSMSIYARQNLVDFQDVGYGSAASTLLFLIVALCTIFYLYIGRRNMNGGT
ncbi:ABC transporter permease [Enterovibrio norvegicus FF-33]|uniref:ABC transporter permease n=1 Tax=Enterovibrio norvegicus FF-454 TaxID=1185651 RepID=A0A1E5C7P2_9GAMM|nr:sugar ABC transporter permease [Enterovibrio norvegicus]OEE61528.1 ABC transporter permease [Enterovibrio norvegicus FF-454]OEE66227.1 ABC transporter permease [Enterovibrio norvegicus FF-33]OEE90479.1 ABC transporter permease [Enterovibrio norvegicus FF-162]